MPKPILARQKADRLTAWLPRDLYARTMQAEHDKWPHPNQRGR